MPEQPEVAQTVDQLHFLLINKVVTSIIGLKGKFLDIGKKTKIVTEKLRLNDSDENSEEDSDTEREVDIHEEIDVLSYKFIEDLPLIITDIFYRGKVVFFVFENKEKTKKWWMINSFRMTGGWKVEKDNYSCVKIEMKPEKRNGVFDITSIYYTDIRRFGTMDFTNDPAEAEKKINDFNYGFLGKYVITFENFKKNIKKCGKKGLASCLMNQRSICSGIGNYLLSEIFYDCAMYPHIKCNELDDTKIKKLYKSCKSVILNSYEIGGVSVKDFTDIYGNKGEYQDNLKVYMKKEDPYGNRVIKEKCNHGRNIFYVPGLQLSNKISQKIKEEDEDEEVEITFDDEED